MRKIISSLLIIISSLSTIYGQPIGVLEVINTSMQDLRLTAIQQNIDFNQSLNYKLPLLRKAEIRLGFNGNITADSLDGGLINEDYFALNFSTNNFKEMRLQKAIQEAQSEVYRAEYQAILNQAIYERYQTLTTLYFNQTLQTERAKLSKLLAEKEGILRLSIEQGLNIRFKDIMDTENDKALLVAALLDYDNNIALQNQRVKQFLNINTELTITIDYQDFINEKNIELIVKNLKNNPSSQHPIVGVKAYQASFSEAEARLENAQNRQIFNFVQLGYNYLNYTPTPLKRFNPSNDIAFRVGLALPLPSNNNLKRAQSALRQKEDELNIGLAQSTQTKNTDNQYIKIENIIKNIRLATLTRQESLITKALNSEKVLAQLSAQETLDLKIADLKATIKQLELRSELTTEYLRFLEFTGTFVRERGKDFLKN